MATRLPLWHRVLVLIIIILVSAVILVWGYVLNVGKIIVHSEPGDIVLIDGRELDPDGKYLAREHNIRVTRPFYNDYSENVEVLRGKSIEIYPNLDYVPHMMSSKEVFAPWLAIDFRADDYIEYPGNLNNYPENLAIPVGLSGDIVRSVFSPGWRYLWAIDTGGVESVYSFVEGKIIWQGKTVGRTFSNDNFIAAIRDSSGISISTLGSDGELQELGVLKDAQSVSLVASPNKDEVLAIDNESGVATLISSSGRERLESAYAITDARFSPDGKKLLTQVRLPGANSAIQLNVFDLESGKDTLLNEKAPINLAVFSHDSSAVYLFERSLPLQADEEEIQRLLNDTRVQMMVDSIEEGDLPFDEFRDALPADINIALELRAINVETAESETIDIKDSPEINSQSYYLDRGDKGELLLLRPGFIDRFVIADPKTL